jgi:hypothetical protein
MVGIHVFVEISSGPGTGSDLAFQGPLLRFFLIAEKMGVFD